MDLSQYALFGERNSGTNYLKTVLDHNFDLKSTTDFGFKHWYIKGLKPRGRINTTTDRECLLTLSDYTDA